MSELKRDIGGGITAIWSRPTKRIFLETAHNCVLLGEEQFRNLIDFHELASRQAWEPLPANPPAHPDMMTL